MGKLSGREFCGIDLLGAQDAIANERSKIDAEGRRFAEIKV